MKKGRLWAFVGYPESLPTDYLDIIQNTGLMCAISPLHNKDVNPDGEIKKEHYHFIVKYDGPTTFNQVKQLTDSLNCTIPIKLESLRGMYRYHLHLDNPEKYQYDDRDRTLLNGFDPKDVDALTQTEIQKLLKDIIIFIKENDILEYSDLLDIFTDNDLCDLLQVAMTHTIMLNTYITSKRHIHENKIKNSLKF